MKKSIAYKYINLLFRIAIGVVAVWLIYSKINTNFLENLTSIEADDLKWGWLLVALLLVIVNWGIEALKWRFAIQNAIQISITKALRLTFTGITIGFLTPNRIGEIPARVALLKSKDFNGILLKTMAASFSQVIITFFVGGIGLMLTQDYFSLGLSHTALNLIVVSTLTVLLLFYFRVKKIATVLTKARFLNTQKLLSALMELRFKVLLSLLMYSLTRYFVFCLQYFLVLKAFGVELINVQAIFLIPVCFLIASTIPTILISEIGVRGSVALFVFGAVSNFDLQIIAASIVLWLINVALPALLGLYDLKELRLMKEK